MKKSLLLIAALFAGSFVYAQTSQRLVLFEEFTQASCPPCATTNPALNTMLNNSADKIVSVKYQTDWPGSDPMNVHNPLQVDTRVAYYSVTGVPDGEMDGNVFNNHPAYLTQAIVNSRAAIAAPFSVVVSHYLTHGPDVIHAHADITCGQATTGTLVAHMAIIERNIYFTTAPGTNGEKHFEGVMKRMLPSDLGTTLATSWTAGQTQAIDLTWNLANVYDTNQLAVVVWIQDNATKEVKQAGYSAPHIPNDAGITASTLASVSCNTSITPSVTLKNFSTINPLISCIITYTVDAGAPVVYNWSGSVATNGTATVVLAPATVTAGASHVFAFSTSMPNGAADLDTHNDGISKTVSVLGPPVTAPLIQAFVAALFPPPGYSRENIDGDTYQWLRSTAGYNGGAGSAYMNFWSAAGGTIDNLYTPAIDFSSAVTGSTLEFDLAHAYYGTGYSDRLKVNVSTNCGATWQTVYNKLDPTLSTVSSTTSWTPTLVTHWRHEVINLNAFVGQASLLIQIQAISGNGNNLFVDNLNVFNSPLSVGTPLSLSGIEVYPNPSNGEVKLAVDFGQPQDMTVTVTNLLGEVVKTINVKDASGIYNIDLKDEAKGNYFVNIKSGKENITKRISITE
jgi:hypothetical protein